MKNTALVQCFTAALKANETFAFWRLPNQNQIFFATNLKAGKSLSHSKEAFYFQRFDGADDSFYYYDNEAVKCFSVENEVFASNKNAFDSNDKEQFKTGVELGKALIREGNLTKIVLSRAVSATVTLDIISSYVNLCQTYTRAFCYVFHNPELGFWMGASPELLCEVSNGTLTSMSLAGTRFADAYSPFTEKERVEQLLVTQFISAKMADLVYRVRISDVEEVQAGNLIHLQTIVSGRLLDSVRTEQIIAALHPTPAVCGLPQSQAMKAIAAIEKYDRSYYTGVVGLLSHANTIQTNAQLFVNLRCMHYKNEKLTAFAGCGIVAASDSESEYIETQQKLRTIQNILIQIT